MGRTFGFCALMTVLLVAPTGAYGQASSVDELSADEQTRLVEVLNAADAACANGDYDAAFDGYAEFLRVLDAAAIRFSVAGCLVSAGRIPEAVADLRAIAARYPDYTDRAERAIEELRAEHPARLEIRVSPNTALVLVDDTPAELADGRTIVEVTPGEHRVEVSADSMATQTETISLEIGETAEVDVMLVAPARPVAAGTSGHATESGGERSGGHRLALPLTLTSLAVGSLAVGTVFAIQHGDRKDEWENYDGTAPGSSADERNRIGDEATSLRTRAGVLLGAGAGLAAASVVSFILMPDRDRDADFVVIPVLDPGAVAARLSLTW